MTLFNPITQFVITARAIHFLPLFFQNDFTEEVSMYVVTVKGLGNGLNRDCTLPGANV